MANFIEWYNKSLKHSITKKLLTIVFSIYLIVTVTLTISHMVLEWRGAGDSVQKELSLFEKIIKPVLVEALWNFDETQVQSTLRGVTNSPAIIGGRVKAGSDNSFVWREGTVVEDDGSVKYMNPESGDLEDPPAGLLRSTPFAHTFKLIHTEYDQSKVVIGEATFYSSNDAIFNQVKMQFLLILLNAFLKTLALWVFFLWMGYLYLTKPLNVLREATHKVGRGDKDVRVILNSRWETELDHLAFNFNTMVEQLDGAREDLTETKNRLTDIIDSMPSLLISVSSEGKIKDWNEYAAQLTRIKPEEAFGRQLAEILPEFEVYMSSVKEALETNSVQKIPNVVMIENDEKHHYDIIIYPVSTSSFEGGVIRVDDITSKVQMESIMVQTEKMSSVGSLAAGMAHEINNPLGSVLQGAQNVLRRIDPAVPANKKVADEFEVDLERLALYFEKRKVTKFLHGIRDAGERAAKIVANLLQFSRRSNANKAPTSLSGIVEKSVELARTDYDLKKKTDFRHVLITQNVEDNLPDIECCSMEVEQVVLNLLKNAGQAMKHMDVPPKIDIKIYKEGHQLVLIIADNGPGMPEKIRKRIFEPFFTTKPVGEGTGLGLSVSYGIIVESHGGEMSVESEENVGTTFTIKLPVAIAKENAEDQDASSVA